ncbi:hypothetical protein GCM10022204_26340 [Microlunatus aurantiacus]|uniref:Uncharacterized protein n=1 Tax=Microlunatus aurantiacus TaxID=446786 RepID=A0ABP7DP47_9ACTN
MDLVNAADEAGEVARQGPGRTPTGARSAPARIIHVVIQLTVVPVVPLEDSIALLRPSRTCSSAEGEREPLGAAV